MDRDRKDLDRRRRRALYRAVHRGSKEMDWLVGRFAEAGIATMDCAAVDVFERLLGTPDPELQSWIMEPSRVTEPEFAIVVGALRRFHGLEP